MLVDPAAVAREGGCFRALPGVSGFFDGEDSAASAEASAAFDHRHESPPVLAVKTRHAQEANISQPLIAAASGLAPVGGKAFLRLRHFGAGQQLVTLRDGELLLPAMALSIGGDEGIGHFLLLRS